jgi:RNA polymerase sigma-70 factor (ECF subfamily)
MTQQFPAEDDALSRQLPEPGELLKHYGDALYRYALARLRQCEDAEDAVQDTLLTAFKARGQFQGRSHPRTWLMAILKRKILDRLRAAARDANGTDSQNLDAWFNDRGKWRRSPRRWHDPADAAERSEFWRVLHSCLGKLPNRMAAAFTLRTMDDRAPDEVCRQLDISSSNLWVLLHRARLRLVRCLQIHWFDAEG